MPRPRKHDPSIPVHIDQRKLPAGCYWHRRDRYWYAKAPFAWLAGADALLSDLHAAMETREGVDRGSLDYMLGKFEASSQFQQLAKSTQSDYRYCRRVLQGFQTRLGLPFAALRRSAITAQAVQRLVDKIGETHPAKANHVKRYLSAAYRWAELRMGVTDNPARGVQQARERGAVVVPDKATMRAFIAFLRARGSRQGRAKGSVAPYLWAVSELAYRCRMRGVEVRELTDAAKTDDGILVMRRKGSLANITAWCPESREAWDFLIARRTRIWRKRCKVLPLSPADRPLAVTEDGSRLRKSTLDSAWDRAIGQALAASVITERFGFHALKHRGITDTEGDRTQRQAAAGHKSAAMTDRYSHRLDIVKPAG